MVKVSFDSYRTDNIIFLIGSMNAKLLKEKIIQAETFIGKRVLRAIIEFGIDGAYMDMGNGEAIRKNDISIDLEGIKNKWMKVIGQDYSLAFIDGERYFVRLEMEE